MLIIERKDGETIDRVLKKYKSKHRRIKLIRELRSRKYFTKPSITRREEIAKAVYIKDKYGDS